MGQPWTTASLWHQVVALQEITHGAAGRPGPIRVLSSEDSKELLGAPARRVPALLEHGGHEVFRRGVRTRPRATALIGQGWWPARLVAVDPLIGRLAAEAEAIRELRQREQPALIIANELDPLVHE